MKSSRTLLVTGISLVLFATVNCIYVPNLHRPCLRCLCEAATGCNMTIGCVTGYCGPFKISRVFWVDADRLVMPEDDPQRPGAYEDCARQYQCASKLVKNYMKKFGQDCNNDGVVNCDDYSMIHYNGGYSCSTPINNTDHYKRYAACRPPDSKEAALLRNSF
ncbi:lysozyme [Anabrus simplex]|uniref:lysozyme n=1 Tax=Anabrus simplex TaxID=316456 RepID=UPI0035A36F69